MRSGVRVGCNFSLVARERALKESRKLRARFSFALSFLPVMAMGDFSESSPG